MSAWLPPQKPGPNNDGGTAPPVSLNEAVYPLAILAVLLGLYIATMSEHASLEDSGALIAVADSAGIAHPPGYPLYTMLGKAFSLIPVGNAAFRIKLLSAVAGALASVCIYFCCLELSPRRRAAAFSCAIFFGVSGLPWNLSVTAEVYTLHAFFYFLLLYLALRLRDRFNSRDLCMMAFLLGLSLSHHLPLTVAGGISFAPLLLGKNPAQRAVFILNHGRKLSGLFLLGLLPYLYLVVREPYISAFGPVSLTDLPGYVLRSRYVSMDSSPTAGAADSALFFLHFLREYVRETGIVGALFAAAGMLLAVVSANKRVAAALLLGFFSTSLILLLFLRVDYDILRRSAYMTYQIIPFGIGAIFLNYSLSAARGVLFENWRRFLPAIAGAAVCITAFAANPAGKNMRANTLAFDYANAVLGAAPENSALFLYGDHDLGPLTYAHTVLGVRPDLRLYSSFGYMFGNRLFNPSGNTIEEAREKLRRFLRREKRLFFIEPAGPFRNLGEFPVYDHGLFYEVSLPGNEKSPIVITRESAKKFLDRHLDDPYKNLWTYHRQQIFGAFCKTVLLFGDYHPALEKNETCKRIYAANLARNGKHEQASALYRGVLKEDASIPFPKTERVSMYAEYIKISVASINKTPVNIEERRKLFRQLVKEVRPAASIPPLCGNKVTEYLLLIRSQVDVDIGLDQLKRSLRHCGNLRPLFKKAADAQY